MGLCPHQTIVKCSYDETPLWTMQMYPKTQDSKMIPLCNKLCSGSQ